MRNFKLTVIVLLAISAGRIVWAAPAANAGPDQTVLDREGDGSETVVLDGSASTGSIVSWAWTEGATTISTTNLCLATFSVGVHTVTLTVTDGQNQTASDNMTVTVNALSGRKQRFNLKDTPTTNRFTRPMTLVWPANPGEANICLWKDDMFAAFTITIDDNLAYDHDWWITQGNKYGWRFTWYVIPNMINVPGRGPWSMFQTLADLGHDVQSHTYDHYSNDLARAESLNIASYRDSITAIEANVTGVKVVSFGWSYGIFSRDVGAIYANSGRGPIGMHNKPEKTDYLSTCSISGHVGAPYIDSVLYGTSSISWLGNNEYLRGWMDSHFHSVYTNNRPTIEAELDYVYQHSTNLWVGLFKDVAFYGQERDTATLTMITNTPSRVAFSVSDEMDDTLFNFPLTVKVKMHPEWTTVRAVQNGSVVGSQIVTNNGALYALVQAVPDQGEISLAPDSAAAGFTVSPASGWAPLTVSFTDTSTITGITSRAWDFGDGVTSNTTATNVTHTYTVAGTNTVTLIVSGSAGVSTNIQIAAVTVMAPVAPSAIFAASPVSGTAPLLVAFTDTSTGTITNRFWNFGDSTTTNTTGTNVTHTFSSIGTNTVRLIVSGPFGVSTNTQAIVVTSPAAPSASFTASPVSGSAPLLVSFVDTSTGSITSRFWNFGDGAVTNTTATNVLHTYTSAGMSTVQLIVSGLAGSSTNIRTALISVTAPGATVTTNIMANSADMDWNSTGVPGYDTRTTVRIGSQGAPTNCAIVIPFWIPALNGMKVVGAELSLTIPTNQGLAYATGLANADVYGVRTSSSPTTVAGDYSNGTLVVDNWFNIRSNLTIGTKTATNSSIATWIYSQVGTNGGTYVFFTVRADALDSTYRFAVVNTANAATGQPMLKLTLENPGSGVADANSNGIPDSWETQYFGGPADASVLAANGVNTIYEAYIAGLNPTNANSVLALAQQQTASQLTLQWSAVSGRVYSIYWSTNLLTGFQPLETNIVWPQNSWTGQVGVSDAFYRLKVQM